MVTATVVRRLPIAYLDGGIERDRLGAKPLLEGCKIDEQLEKRAGLTFCLRDPIELTFCVFATADHGENCAVRSHRHESRLADVFLAPSADNRRAITFSAMDWRFRSSVPRTVMSAEKEPTNRFTSVLSTSTK